MSQESDPSRLIQVISGFSDRPDQRYITEIPYWILENCTNLGPDKFEGDKLHLHKSLDRGEVKKICNWMKDSARQDEILPLPWPEEFPSALLLYQAIMNLRVPLSLIGSDFSDALLSYVSGPALSHEEFFLVMRGTRVNSRLWRAAIAGTEARYQDGLRGGFKGVPDRREIIAIAAEWGVDIKLGQDEAVKVLKRADTPVDRSGIGYEEQWPCL